MIEKDLKSSSGGSGITLFPSMPVPLKDEGYISQIGQRIPHKGTLIDNLLMSRHSSESRLGLLKNSVVWTVSLASFNNAVDAWLGVNAVWYDSVNDRLYVFGVDTGTSPYTLYTAYITLETGVVTNIGNVKLTANTGDATGVGAYSVNRTAIDSGHFTLTGNLRTLVINSATGAEISNVASVNASTNNFIGNYVTSDGTTHLGKSVRVGTNAQMFVTKNANTSIIPAPENLFQSSDSLIVYAVPWGDKVKLFEASQVGGRAILRTFKRSDFDSWLIKLANFGGLA